MTMVKSSALAIIVNSTVYLRVFLEILCVSGSGQEAGSNGGRPEARLGCPRTRMSRWDVASVGRKLSLRGLSWRAELGPMLRCVRPRPLRFARGLGFSFERLVLAEVGDGHSERVDRNQFVGHLGLEKEDKVRGVQIALQLAMVGGRVIDHVEVHARAEGGRLHLFERDFLYVHIDLGRCGIRDEFLDDVVLAVGIENAVRKLAVEEVQGLRKIILNRVSVAAVVEGAKLREKILRFGVLRFVFKVVVVDGLGSTQIVDADDERAEILEGANGPEVDERERHANDGQQSEGNLEIGIRYHGITVLFEIEPLGILKCGISVHHITLLRTAAGASKRPADEPPAVPLKM